MKVFHCCRDDHSLKDFGTRQGGTSMVAFLRSGSSLSVCRSCIGSCRSATSCIWCGNCGRTTCNGTWRGRFANSNLFWECCPNSWFPHQMNVHDCSASLCVPFSEKKWRKYGAIAQLDIANMVDWCKAFVRNKRGRLLPWSMQLAWCKSTYVTELDSRRILAGGGVRNDSYNWGSTATEPYRDEKPQLQRNGWVMHFIVSKRCRWS